MREIKFRAYDKQEKKIILSSTLFRWGTYIDTFNGYLVAFDKDNNKMIKVKEIIPLQYTSLKDKNSKEIYEGDIVNYDEKTYGIGFRRGSFMMLEFDVVLEGDLVSGEIWKGRLMQGIDEDEIEIIGNIYENPELLEEE